MIVRHAKSVRNVPSRRAPRRDAAQPEPPAGSAASDSIGQSASAAERALRIVAEVAKAGVGLSLADLAERLGLPKATLHRQCGILLASGFVARDVDPQRYVVGPALRRLAIDTLNHGHLRALRRRVLAALVDDVQETCNFTALDGDEVLYVDRVEARWPLRLTLDVGSHVPLHCTASGKLLLAHLPAADADLLIDNVSLAPFTRNTITQAARLRRECAAIRRVGWSADREEFITGLIAVAVPVRDADGVVRAAIAMHAPIARVTVEAAARRLPRLRAAAAEMGGLL